jgi:copper homeostasis protein
MQIEVCASTINSVLNAKLANAHRVELCTELGLGGLTPSFGMIKQATLLDLPIHVLIRPRSGHFVYSKDEIKMMYDDIIQCKEMGCDGVVVGALNKMYDLAHEVLATMVALARPMQITFHRAFDLVKDPQKTLETLVDLGFDRILSSGQNNTALEGLPLLQKILQWSDHRIEIMPGGGDQF